jgi:hypothetical protein
MSWGDDTRTQRAARLLRTFAVDPLRVSRALPGEFRQAYRSAGYHGADADQAWEEHLHGLLGAAWPCREGEHLDELMSDVGALLAARGWGFGRDNTYGWYADADSSLCRAVWCTVIHARPEVVIETGVAHGVTSRIVLEALRQNGCGHLWSIDLPFPFDHRLHAETGAAVTEACRDRWSYLEGSSRQRLPSLVADLGHVELFIHDSLHTARNTVFEMQQTASRMPPGGVMLVDDISMHGGFAGFAGRHPGYRTIVCPHADRSSQFGIAVNAASPGSPVS